MKKSNQLALTVLAYGIMALFGFMENIRGAIIPDIKREFAVDYSSIGLMLCIAGAGYLISPFIGGIAIDRYGRKLVLLVGLMHVAGGVVGMQYVTSFPLLVMLMTLMTAGFGLIEVGLNALAAQIFVANAAVMMSYLHLFYGAGAAGSPKYAGLLLSHDVSWRRIYLFALVLVAGTLVFLMSCRFPLDSAGESESALPLKEIVQDRRVWLFVLVLGFCQLAEHGVSNWLVNFLQTQRGMDEGSSSQYLSMFFLTFTLGRLVGGYLAERIGYLETVLFATILSLVLFGGGLLGGANCAFMFSLMGFFVSVKYPTVMTIIMKEFSQGMGSAMGFIIAGAATVSMTFNWLIGRTNDLVGVNAGFGSLLIYTGFIILFLAPLGRMLTYNNRPVLAGG